MERISAFPASDINPHSCKPVRQRVHSSVLSNLEQGQTSADFVIEAL